MITDIFLNTLFLFVGGIVSVLSLLGTVNEESLIVSGVAAISSYIVPLNNMLPIDTFLLIIAFELTFEALYLGYKAIKWSYTKVPGVS